MRSAPRRCSWRSRSFPPATAALAESVQAADGRAGRRTRSGPGSRYWTPGGSRLYRTCTWHGAPLGFGAFAAATGAAGPERDAAACSRREYARSIEAAAAAGRTGSESRRTGSRPSAHSSPGTRASRSRCSPARARAAGDRQACRQGLAAPASEFGRPARPPPPSGAARRASRAWPSASSRPRSGGASPRTAAQKFSSSRRYGSTSSAACSSPFRKTRASLRVPRVGHAQLALRAERVQARGARRRSRSGTSASTSPKRSTPGEALVDAAAAEQLLAVDASGSPPASRRDALTQ